MLHPQGIFVIQMTDLMSMMKVRAFDNICHEHLEYYSLDIVDRLVRSNGMRIFDVEYNEVNGHSVRIYIDKGRREPRDSVRDALWNEERYMQMDSMEAFAEHVQKAKHATKEYIKEAHENNELIYGMGASTKGNTLLQYFGINAHDLPCIVEINEDKYGLTTVGTNIPIFPQSLVGNGLGWPDIYFVLPWHFIHNFIEHNQEFLDRGGRFFVPLPFPTEIYKKGGKMIWESKLKPLEL
jgi:hypothetical protein